QQLLRAGLAQLQLLLQLGDNAVALEARQQLRVDGNIEKVVWHGRPHCKSGLRIDHARAVKRASLKCQRAECGRNKDGCVRVGGDYWILPSRSPLPTSTPLWRRMP